MSCLTDETSVPTAPLREAYFRAMAAGVSMNSICEEMGWTKITVTARGGRAGDVSRLLRMLGLRHDDGSTQGPLLEKRVKYETAVLFVRALDRCGSMHIDPVDIGV